jgi:hypothetical protein
LRSRLILPLIILEIITQVFLVRYWADVSSIIHLVAGLMIGYLMIAQPKNETEAKVKITSTLWRNIILLTGLLMLGSYAKELFQELALDYRIADMLPIMHIMNERFINGSDPYTIIPEIWGGMQPIYLPGLWLPYLPAVAFDFDMRWISIAALGISSVMVYSKPKSIRSVPPTYLLPFVLLLVLIISVDPSLITMTQESIVILWYVCMIWALLNDRPFWFGLFAALSLMSRYAIAPWLIMIGVLLMIQKRFKFLKLTVLTGTISIALLLMVSGAYNYSEVFLGLSDSYLVDIQSNQAKYQGLIDHGLGLAKFFPYDQLHHLHSLMQYLAILVPLGLGGIYYLKRDQIEFKFFALGSMKICLVLFYGLIIMPYSYLFYPSIFLSLMILTRMNCKTID